MNNFQKMIGFCVLSLFTVIFLSCSADSSSEVSPEIYAVAYQTEHGTAPAPFTVKENTVLASSQLPELSENGYRFLGWYDGDLQALAYEYKVTKNVTLTAKWKKSETSNDNKNPSDKTDADKASTDKTDADKTNTDKIKTEETKKFYVNYYDNTRGTSTSTIYVDENTVLTSEQLPELEYDGYIFEGWYDGDTKAVAGEYKVTKNVQLTAKWIQNSSITVQIPENTDISLTAQKNGSGSAWTLTAESGFTNYSWRVDGKVQSETSNILILNVSDWTRGYYEVSVEAQKDGEYYSARANITVGGN